MVYDVKERHEPTVILGDIWLKNSDLSLKHFTINCQEIYLKLKKCFNYKKPHIQLNTVKVNTVKRS